MYTPCLSLVTEHMCVYTKSPLCPAAPKLACRHVSRTLACITKRQRQRLVFIHPMHLTFPKQACRHVSRVTVRMWSFGWRGGTLACITKRQRQRRGFDRVVFVTGLKYPSLSSMIPITQVIYPVSISKSPSREMVRALLEFLSSRKWCERFLSRISCE